MRIFMLKNFAKWIKKEKINTNSLINAIDEIKAGSRDANLGENIYKHRIPLNNKGKRSGARTIVAHISESSSSFIFGYTKSKRDNITADELNTFIAMGNTLLEYNNDHLNLAIKSGALKEIINGKIRNKDSDA